MECDTLEQVGEALDGGADTILLDNMTPSQVAEAVAVAAGRAKLEASGITMAVPYRKVPALGIAVAFFTDPWGTYIELTEGLDKVS